MRLPRTRRARAAEDNVLPLINVVFLLLIFFMIVGRMTVSGSLRSEPPRAELGDPLTANPVLVIDADGVMAWRSERISRDALIERARRWTGGKFVVRADGGLAHNVLMRRIGWLRDAGLDEITLVTERAR